MPHAAVQSDYFLMERGEQRQYVRGEIVFVPPHDNLVLSGRVSPISDSDVKETALCRCGRRFWSDSHPHFTIEPAEGCGVVKAEPEKARKRAEVAA